MESRKNRLLLILSCLICLCACILPIRTKLHVEVSGYCREDGTTITMELDGWYYWYLLKADQISVNAQVSGKTETVKLQALIDEEKQPLFIWNQQNGYLQNGWIMANTFLRQAEMHFVDAQGNEYIFQR